MPSTFAKNFFANGGKATFASPERAGKAEEYKNLEAKLNAEALANWGEPSWHRQVAADVTEVLDYGFVSENIFGTYIDTRVVGEFDREVVKTRRGLKVYTTARGGYVDESQMTSDVFEVPRDSMGFHVSESEDRIRANFASALSEIVTLGDARLATELNRRLFAMFQTAVHGGDASYITGAGLSKVALDAAIRAVKDAVKPDGVGPVPITIIGRATMIDQISDFAGFANEAVEEIRLKGRLGVYRGCNLVVTHNYVDEDGVNFQPANELFIFGGTAGRFVKYGGTRSKQWIENTVDYFHHRSVMDFGGLIWDNTQVRRVVDSSQGA